MQKLVISLLIILPYIQEVCLIFKSSLKPHLKDDLQEAALKNATLLVNQLN